MIEKWVNNIHRDDFTARNVTKNSRVCSRHFQESDYEVRAEDQKPMLRPLVAPSVFEDYPMHLQQKETKVRSDSSIRKRKQALANSPSKRAKLVHQDHTYSSKVSPKKAQMLKSMKEKRKQLKIKTLQQKVRRKNQKIKTLGGHLKLLQKENKLAKDSLSLLEHEFGGLSMELIRNMTKNHGKSAKAHRYSQMIKQFAVTLHYHSPKAYRYMRKIIPLPHPASLRNWCMSIDCKPGFLSDVLEQLKSKLSSNEITCDVALVIDGMSIRKQTQWDRREQCYSGTVYKCNNKISSSTCINERG